MSDEQLIPTPGVFGETGNFLLERELGRGGMGGVYMGRDKMLDRPVAVKVMLKEYGDDPEFVEKFKREAQAAARLIHPNIAQVYSYGIAEGMPYIAMELVAGGSLDQLMRNAGAAIDIPRVMKICEQVAQALRCAADQGVVHGDVKPENVLLDANGNAKLVDFGLAAMQKDTDEVWGTPYYIAPEKVRKEQVDYRADMYSLGGTIYHALTGVAPFEGTDATEVVRKRFEGAPVAPSKVRAEISPAIDALVLRMLALNPADRFPSFEALLAEFKSVMTHGLTAGGSSSATTTSTGGRKLAIKGRRRFKVKTATSAAAVGGESGEGGESASVNDRYARLKGASEYDDSSDDSGGVFGKVLGVVVLVFLAIGIVAGGLTWYVISDRNARAAAKQAQITSQIGKAKESIEDTRKNAAKFADEVDAMAMKAVRECDKASDKLLQVLAGKVDASKLKGLKPGPTKELLDAIASTNNVQVAEAGTNATATAEGTAATTTAAAPAGAAPAVAAVEIPKFRPPDDSEADTASPEHAEYLKKKAAWEKEQREKLQREAAEKAAEEESSSESESEEETASSGQSEGDAELAKAKAKFESSTSEALSIVTRDMEGLWERAYGSQAASIRIRKQINELLEKIDAFKIEGDDEATMTKAANFSNEAKDAYDRVKASDDVSKVQKAVNYIQSRGANSVKQTSDRLFIAIREYERDVEAIKKRIEAAEKVKQDAEHKAKTIEEDNQKVKDKFDALTQAGTFRQLNWNGAIRQIKALSDEFEFSESQIFANIYIKKVEMMAIVQEVFIANCKGMKFQRSKLRGWTIEDISEKDGFRFLKPDGKTRARMTWVKFYQNFHGNLNELIVRLIEKGKDVSKLKGGKRLSLQPWAEAMMGAALTMQIICGDDPAAPTRAEAIAKEAVKALPDYLGHAQEIFPDFKFDANIEE